MSGYAGCEHRQLTEFPLAWEVTELRKRELKAWGSDMSACCTTIRVLHLLAAWCDVVFREFVCCERKNVYHLRIREKKQKSVNPFDEVRK